MKKYPDDIKFKFSWRKYQERVLNDLQDHLTDQHLHIIAPPGSGKTVLGLEVAIRINKPTLILAPTIAIRNQWIQRFCELFLQTHDTPEWISRDIRNPKFMTVLTYQGMHAACNNLRSEDEEEDVEDEEERAENGEEISKNSNLKNIVAGLQSQEIKTIVVDEAHHLKNEWWQTLTQLKAHLQPIIVGLTATPPYDVSPTEWQRYLELNGPVDAEITVPELIIAGDLCPHQDYVLFTSPTANETENIVQFRKKIERLFQELKSDPTIIEAIQSHPVWKNPEAELDWIYTNLPYYSSCLIYLHANAVEIPKLHLDIVGDKNLKIPKLDYGWIETLLDFYLYKDQNHFIAYEGHIKLTENKLRRYGAIERRQINFSHNKRVTGFLTSSISKLNGIKQIVDFEYEQLGKELRLVILTDYIRKEFFPQARENSIELNKIGVIPIFEKLRRDNTDHKKIGVLTGSIIIIPQAAVETFKNTALKYGIAKINCSDVPYDNSYVQIHPNEQLKHSIVHIITHIFQSGEIDVLVGTKSLLGEGWDAPAINALILASFVGSFVLSNQMRGRAIRTQNGNLEKTGNIWHLACLDPTSSTGGDDFDLLKRRFRSFVGVSFGEYPSIENGIGRLNLPENIQQKEEGEKKNEEMFYEAGSRGKLKKRWELALQSGHNLVEEIKVPSGEEKDFYTRKSLYFNKTIAYLFAMMGSVALSYFHILLEFTEILARLEISLAAFSKWIVGLAILGVFIFGIKFFKAFRLYIQYRDITKDIQQIGNALLATLIEIEIIHSSKTELTVETSVDKWGFVYCHLEGGTTFEKSTFINALQEIIIPIDNPRYVIMRKNISMHFLKQKDYHSVPEIIGRNKNLAEHFEKNWKKNVGSCELIFTRNREGRKLLLVSRVKSLSSQLDDKVEHVNKWR